VLLDKHAAAADHIGVVARIKPHTGYAGPIESGLFSRVATPHLATAGSGLAMPTQLR
jgi:hypothetical protein